MGVQMGGITFRGRKYHEIMNASFNLYDRHFDRETLGDLSHYLVGDVVVVCFKGMHEKELAIVENCPDQTIGFGGHGLLHIMCVVVQRSHSIVWESTGKFVPLITASVVLEAQSGFWEDILRWVILDEKPAWIPDDWKEDHEV